jgi:hypothetical protein
MTSSIKRAKNREASAMQTANRSTIAQLLAQVEAEYVAAKRALEVPRAVGSHRSVNRHMENLGTYVEQLEAAIGDRDQAMALVVQQMEEAMAEPEAAPAQEPLLNYLQWRWEGEATDGTFVWMLDATFQRYVSVWLEARGITSPTREQRDEALQACRKLRFWRGCRDKDVHFAGRHYVQGLQQRAREEVQRKVREELQR